jgi:phosphatidylglycerophosphatase A
MRFPAKVLSTFFGAGYFPVAPGTFASLVAALLYKYLLVQLNVLFYAALIVLIFFVGVMTSGVFSKALGQKDPRKIVIDEVCGQFIAYVFVPGQWSNVLLGFFLFRVFDVIKLYPIRKLENLPGGWGIMADDVLAAIYSAILVHVYLWLK